MRVTLNLVLSWVLLLLKFVLIWLLFNFIGSSIFVTGTLGDGTASNMVSIGDGATSDMGNLVDSLTIFLSELIFSAVSLRSFMPLLCFEEQVP